MTTTLLAADRDESSGRMLYTGGEPLDRAASWTHLPSDERRRRAVAACHAHDVVVLWDLTQAWTTLHGAAGAMASYHTRRTYRAGVMALLAFWQGENLLHPSPDAGALWLRHLEAAGGHDKEGNPKGLAPVPPAGCAGLGRPWMPPSLACVRCDRTVPWEKHIPSSPGECLVLTGADDGGGDRSTDHADACG